MDGSSARGVVGWAGIAVVVLVAAAATWIAFRAMDDHGLGGNTLAQARAEGVIRIAYANERPYGFEDPATGDVTGEAPEIARVVFARLGIERVEPTVAEFGTLIDGLKAGRWDVVAAGMYVTPERCREVAFSNPTYVVKEAFLVEAGNPRDLHSYEDVREDEGARLAVMGGAVEHGYAQALGIPEDRIAVFADYATALVALDGDRVHAIGATRLTVDSLLEQAGGGVERAEPFVEPRIGGEVQRGHGAFAFRKADVALREAFDEALAAFLGSEEHLALVAPFGFGRHTLPGDATAAGLCGGGD